MIDYQEVINGFYPLDRAERANRVKENEVIIEACLGLAGESGETIDIIKKHVYYGKPLDRKALLEELGDTLHYLTRLCELSGFDLTEVAHCNIRKLRKRFKMGVTEAAAIAQGERDDKINT